MATSLMLRDECSRIVGYVLMMENRLLCRVNAAADDAQLVVLSGDMALTAFSLPGGGNEHAFTYMQSLISAYVRCKGELIASTDEQARAAFFAATEKEKKPEENDDRACKKEAVCAVYTEGESGGVSCLGREHPQARWPPPPCRPLARYVDGVWMEEGG